MTENKSPQDIIGEVLHQNLINAGYKIIKTIDENHKFKSFSPDLQYSPNFESVAGMIEDQKGLYVELAEANDAMLYKNSEISRIKNDNIAWARNYAQKCNETEDLKRKIESNQIIETTEDILTLQDAFSIFMNSYAISASKIDTLNSSLRQVLDIVYTRTETPPDNIKINKISLNEAYQVFTLEWREMYGDKKNLIKNEVAIKNGLCDILCAIYKNAERQKNKNLTNVLKRIKITSENRTDVKINATKDVLASTALDLTSSLSKIENVCAKALKEKK